MSSPKNPASRLRAVLAASFLGPYVKPLAEKSRAPHIAEIQILTPFAQVVDLSRRFTSGYTEEQALREYRQRGDTS